MSKALASWDSFRAAITSREEELASMLPRHISRERFINSSLAAVKQNPDLLKCTARSMMTAVTRSAQDGLLPDGREGVITPYQGDAQWNPMTHGLRKRARELDGIIVDAQVVHEKDHFEWEQGDDPKLVHKPAPLGTDRGEMVGAYAIFKRGNEILHREVMGAPDIEKVRSQSKQPNGLLWAKFTPEAWRKTVIRRGFKSVPCSERLETIVRRDEDAFDFPEPDREKPRVVSAPGSAARKPLPPVAGVPVEFDEQATEQAGATESENTADLSTEDQQQDEGSGFPGDRPVDEKQPPKEKSSRKAAKPAEKQAPKADENPDPNAKWKIDTDAVSYLATFKAMLRHTTADDDVNAMLGVNSGRIAALPDETQQAIFKAADERKEALPNLKQEQQ